MTYIFKRRVTVGPKYSSSWPDSERPVGLDGNTAYAQLQEKGQNHSARVDASIELTEDDLLITMTQKEGYVTDGDNNVTVVLNTNLTTMLCRRRGGSMNHLKAADHAQGGGFQVMDPHAIAYRGNEDRRDLRGTW